MRLNPVRSCAVSLVFALACGLALAPGARAQYYVSAHGGGVIADDANTPISAAGITVRGETDFDPGFMFGGAVGYRWKELRVEGEAAYRTRDADSYTATAVSGAGFGTITGVATAPLSDTDLSSLAFMVNGWYDIRTQTPWRPYLGGGIGAAIANLNVGSADTGSNEFDDSDIVLAYQLGIGLDYEVNPSMRVGVGYRYFATTDPEFNDTVGGVPFRIETEVSTHNLLVGVMFKM